MYSFSYIRICSRPMLTAQWFKIQCYLIWPWAQSFYVLMMIVASVLIVSASLYRLKFVQFYIERNDSEFCTWNWKFTHLFGIHKQFCLSCSSFIFESSNTRLSSLSLRQSNNFHMCFFNEKSTQWIEATTTTTTTKNPTYFRLKVLCRNHVPEFHSILIWFPLISTIPGLEKKTDR